MAWKGLNCSPTLSSFVSPLVKTDYPGAEWAENQVTCKEGRWREAGGKCSLLSGCSWGLNGVCWGEGSGCVCSVTGTSTICCLGFLHHLLVLHPDFWCWQYMTEVWERAVATISGLLLYINVRIYIYTRIFIFVYEYLSSPCSSVWP